MGFETPMLRWLLKLEMDLNFVPMGFETIFSTNFIFLFI